MAERDPVRLGAGQPGAARRSSGQAYGGFKTSGIGRELSLEGMLEGFTQIKQVNVKTAGPAQQTRG